MSDQPLTPEERAFLLRLARRSIECAAAGLELPAMDAQDLTAALSEPGASFVTLTIDGRLRGCIGALQAYQPLAEDVREHAADAAMSDYRFPPVRVQEVTMLKIEISRLTTPVRLEYDQPALLPTLLRPGVDGVVLQDGTRRATFLPQVWQSLPSPTAFLGQLCQKMGASASLWQQKVLQVSLYQVEEFAED
ncbi:MAG: AmmeMemoRadiSam system protein A [Anaerolineaceae bacterium]|nr:AmmeMemoRadiSam system protein A [Anaerolineaceae bacterium]